MLSAAVLRKVLRQHHLRIVSCPDSVIRYLQVFTPQVPTITGTRCCGNPDEMYKQAVQS